jgi:hypothetical protein
MRLDHRIRRLEESGGRKRRLWAIFLPEMPLTELQRIEREIRPGDAVFCFDLRAGLEPDESDAQKDEVVRSIFNRESFYE